MSVFHQTASAVSHTRAVVRPKEPDMAFEKLKQRQSVMWGNGPYERVTDTIRDIHALVIDRVAPRTGDRWLDLASGTGAVAERAARAGADVTGIDLAPA